MRELKVLKFGGPSVGGAEALPWVAGSMVAAALHALSGSA